MVMGINIIKKENLVEVVSVQPSNRGDMEVSKKFPYSELEVSLYKGGIMGDIVEIVSDGKLEYRVTLSEVTIQSGSDGTPVQATADNWDELRMT